MAKQKRLNKNMVAFVTTMAMVLIISVAALIIWQQSRRDPRVLADSARQSEQAGDLEEACRRYLRAYAASEARGERDTKYMVEAARCSFVMGEVGNWRDLLTKTTANVPDDQPLRRALLDGLWQIQEITGAAYWPEVWRDTGRRLHELDPNNVLALASYAHGLWGMPGGEDVAAGDEAARQAFAAQPRDPRVALTYAALLQRQAVESFRKARAAGARAADVTELERQAVADVLAVLAAAVAEHPGDMRLVTVYVDSLRSEARRLEREKDTGRAIELLASAGAVLEKAAAANADHPVGALYLALAQHRLLEFGRAHEDPTAAEIAELRGDLEAIDNDAKRAAELDPALYDAYLLRAELKRFELGPQGERLPLARQLEKMLEVFDAARVATLTLRNVRAVLRDGGPAPDRLLMLRRALEVALGLWSQAPEGPEGAQGLAQAEVVLKDAAAKYPEHALTHYMQAQLLAARNDFIGATAKFESAYARAEQARVGQARFWFAAARVSRLPAEQLALLYRQREQFGEAQKYAELATGAYEEAGLTPPASLLVAAAELFVQLDRAQDALDLLNAYRQEYPDEQSLAAARAAVLTKLGRKPEADAAAALVSATDVPTDLWRAQIALGQEDYAKAETILRGVLKNEAIKPLQFQEALGRLVAVLQRTKRHKEARELVLALKQNPPQEGLTRLLEAYELELSVDDPEKLSSEEKKALDAKREQIIAANPDPLARALEYYRFRAAHGDWQRAVGYLEELRKAQPDELRIAEEEFRVRIRLEQYKEAADIAAKLAQHKQGLGFDQAGGATYRGELALAQGDGALAIREFRQAVQALPKSDDLQIKLARAYLVAGRTTEGIDALNEAKALNPRSFEAHWLLREVYRQRMAESFGAEREENRALADQAQARATELNPDHPEVQMWRQEEMEDKDPLAAIAAREKLRLEKPADAENLQRLGELFVAAWAQVDKSPDAQARQKLTEQGGQFFEAVVPQATERAQFDLAQSAAEFFARSQRVEQGEALLRGLVRQHTDEAKVSMQLLLASFFEGLGNADAAEREYQQAQRLIGEVTQDADMRRRLDLLVGRALIAFHQRRNQGDKVAITCRWLLDRFGPEATLDPGIQQVRLTLIQALFNARQLGDIEVEISDYLGRKYAERIKVLQKQAKDFKAIDLPGTEFGDEDLLWLSFRAQLHMARRAREKALQDLSQILEKTPENVWALYSRGRLSLERGRYEKAREDLTKALELIARVPRLELEVRGQLAALYGRTKQLDQAAAQLRAMLDTLERQGAAPEQKQQVVAQLGRLLYGEMGQFDQAQKLIGEHMERHPDEAIWPLELGRLFEARAKTQKREQDKTRDYDQAATYYQRAADTSGEKNVGEMVTAVIHRLGALTRAKRARDAVEVYQKMAALRLPADVQPELAAEIRARLEAEAAKAFQELKQDDDARTLWQQVLRDASVRRLALLGELASDLRAARPADAEALLRQVAESAPLESLPGQRLRAVLAAHLATSGNSAAALPLLGEVLEKAAPNTPEHLGTLLQQAQALDAIKDTEAAVKTYRAVLTAYPDDMTALNNLAYSLVTSEKVFAPKEALKYAERLRGLVTGGEGAGTLLDTIGWVYFQNGELDLAVAALEEAVSLGGPSAVVCQHLAEAYQKLNRLADARAALNQGLEQARREGAAENIRQLEEALKKLP